jgi:ribosomal protein L3 glutamine methyltransferase
MAGLPLEYQKEPVIALSGGKDGLDIVHRIIHGAAERLSSNGGLLLEVGRCYPQMEKAYPGLMREAVWIDTSLSSGEVFYFSRSALMHCLPKQTKKIIRTMRSS